MKREQFLHPGLNLGSTDEYSHAQSEPVIFGFWVFLMADLVLFAIPVSYTHLTLPTNREV